jgi:hypothetical protein
LDEPVIARPPSARDSWIWNVPLARRSDALTVPLTLIRISPYEVINETMLFAPTRVIVAHEKDSAKTEMTSSPVWKSVIVSGSVSGESKPER